MPFFGTGGNTNVSGYYCFLHCSINIGDYFPLGGTILNHMGMIGGWGGYVKHQIRLLHTKYTFALSLVVSEKKIIFIWLVIKVHYLFTHFSSVFHDAAAT